VDTCSCFSLAQGCCSWRLCRKMNVVNTYSYPMSMFKEFYNKWLAIKKIVLQNFLGSPISFLPYITQVVSIATLGFCSHCSFACFLQSTKIKVTLNEKNVNLLLSYRM
jgi:hypothetical protein